VLWCIQRGDHRSMTSGPERPITGALSRPALPSRVGCSHENKNAPLFSRSVTRGQAATDRKGFALFFQVQPPQAGSVAPWRWLCFFRSVTRGEALRIGPARSSNFCAPVGRKRVLIWKCLKHERLGMVDVRCGRWAFADFASLREIVRQSARIFRICRAR
jgi:hypothetical protein